MLLIIHIIGIALLGSFILFLYACLLINRDNRTERALLKAKEIIKEQNEKIKLLESELDAIELEELKKIDER